MNRRNFMTALAAGCAALAAPRTALTNRRSDKRPNIIVFLTDDQDKESIGAYGAKVMTPNLDRMAREGIIFHNAFVTSTVCTPSRYSFLTGRYAGNARDETYLRECPPGSQGFPAFNVELETDNMNVGAVLTAAGYMTGYTGKFHVGPSLKNEADHKKFGLKYAPKDAPANAQTSEAFRFKELWNRSYLKKRGFTWAKNVYWQNMNKPYSKHNLEWTVSAALEFIQANKDRPFYLHCCTTLVHGPDKSWSTSMEYPLVTGAGEIDKPITPEGMTPRKEILAKLKKANLDPQAGHAGYSWIDAGVGAIVSKLKKLGIDDNTLLIFTADHGSNMKGSLFDVDGACVPFIARWPDGIKAGAESSQLIQSIDIAATCFDLSGAKKPEKYKLDGRSIKPLLAGKKAPDWRDHVYIELGFARAIRTADWKYLAIRYTKEQLQAITKARPEKLPAMMSPLGRMGIGTRGAKNPNFYTEDQLYYIRKDPLEKKNLAASPEHAKHLEKMRAMLTRDIKRIGRPYGEFAPGGDAAPPGQVDKQLALVKRIKIQGKKIILPDDAKGSAPATKPPTRDDKAERKKLRDARKKARG